MCVPGPRPRTRSPCAAPSRNYDVDPADDNQLQTDQAAAAEVSSLNSKREPHTPDADDAVRLRAMPIVCCYGALTLHDLVIRGGTIIDGTGRLSFHGEVAIDGQRIVAVGNVGCRTKA